MTEICALPWYDTVQLIRLRSRNWQPGQITYYWLYEESKDLFYRLSGKSAPIHEVNDKFGIKLSQENVIFYLIFFCYFLHGNDDTGPFLIISEIDDPAIPRTVLCQRTVAGTIRLPSFEGVSNEGGFLIDAVTMYTNAIFLVNFV